jgi:hypothetical protein
VGRARGAVDVVALIAENEGRLEPVAIEFDAEMRQVKSMADGTYNIVLNVPEYCLPQVKEMMGWLKSLVKIVMVEE